MIDSPSKPFWGLFGKESNARFDFRVSAGSVVNRSRLVVPNGGFDKQFIRDGILDPSGVADAHKAVMEQVWESIANIEPGNHKEHLAYSLIVLLILLKAPKLRYFSIWYNRSL